MLIVAGETEKQNCTIITTSAANSERSHRKFEKLRGVGRELNIKETKYFEVTNSFKGYTLGTNYFYSAYSCKLLWSIVLLAHINSLIIVLKLCGLISPN